MTIFDKPVSSYFRFAGPAALLVFLVGMTRLTLSLNGVPNGQTKFLSMNVALLLGVIYLGIRTWTSGFGSYKQLLPAVLVPDTVMHILAITGITIAILTGRSNAFEFAFGEEQETWSHAAAHVAGGMVVGGLVNWLIGCVVLRITKRFTKNRSASAAHA